MNYSLRNVIIGIIVLVLAIAIPVTVRLAREQQQLKSKAASSPGGEIKFRGSNVSGAGCTASSGDCSTTDRNIQLEITNPFSAGP